MSAFPGQPASPLSVEHPSTSLSTAVHPQTRKRKQAVGVAAPKDQSGLLLLCILVRGKNKFAGVQPRAAPWAGKPQVGVWIRGCVLISSINNYASETADLPSGLYPHTNRSILFNTFY